jgi:predicted AAA+ superfamily ATPase
VSARADGAAESAVSAYFALQGAVLNMVGGEEVAANYWQNHICKLVGPSDNAFSRLAEKGAFAAFEDGTADGGASLGRMAARPSATALPVSAGVADAVFALAVRDLAEIRRIYAYDFGLLARAVSEQAGGGATEAIAANPAQLPAEPARTSRRQRIHEALSAADARTAAAMLARYYRLFGAGDFEGYDAFRWDRGFHGVAAADPISMDGLIGYESRKRALIENTECLLRGLPCNNVLLCGDSGTGKSSSVKALLNLYRDRGLKLIAVPKEQMDDLPAILEHTGERGLKFIIFIDDLSFEENEISYKSFKSAIEGSVSARAFNTVIYVTSNRRNIVKEVWKDREDGDDIHLRDNLQEKRSLADRFGLTLVYAAPDKKEYLEMITALAEKAGLRTDEEKLREAALRWEIRRGGRSGRTARQFIDHMIGVEALEDRKQEGNRHG